MDSSHIFRGITIAVAIAFIGLEALTIHATLAPRAVGILGYETRTTGGRHLVTAVAPGVPLQPGDRIVSIDGDRRAASAGPAFILFRRAPGSQYRLTVDRAGMIVEVATTVLVRRSKPDPWLVSGFLLLGLCYHLLGFVAGWSRTDHPTARALWISSSVYSLVFVARAVMPSIALGSMPDWAYLTGLVFGWDTLTTYLVFAAFPGPISESAAWRSMRRVVIATSLASFSIALLRTIDHAGWTSDLGFAAQSLYNTHLSVLKQTQLWLAVLGKVLILAVILRNYLHFSAPSDRRRIRLVLGAMAFQLVWLSSFQLAFLAGVPVNQGLTLLSLAPSLLVVVALLYAMQKHQVLGIQLIIRRTVQYALARGTLECISALPFIVVVVRVLLRPDASAMALIAPLPLFAAILAVGVASPVYRTPLLRLMDRVFFRRMMEEEVLLHRILELTQRHPPFSELLEIATGEIEQALQPRFLSIACPIAGSAEVDSVQDDAEAALLIAIRRPSGICVGHIRLGPRKSDEPYTNSNRQLLRMIGSQIGLALDNHLLTMERVEAVMAERNRIARELHDTMAQGLAGIGLHLESARSMLKGSHPAAETHLAKAAELARSSSSEARRSVQNLRSHEAEPGTRELIHKLKEVAAKFSGRDLQIDVQHRGDRRLPVPVSRNLLRIAQESVTNAVKHASPSEIHIQVQLGATEVRLTVTDNGRGFDMNNVRPGRFGLVGMRERAVEINAQLEIASTPGAGTTVCAGVQC